MTTQTAAAQLIRRSGLIAIIRGQFSRQQVVGIAETLLANQIVVVEVTLNTTGALTAITYLREHFADKMLVGAGTVRTAEQLRAVLDAGAQFTVSPNLDLATVELAQRRDLLHLPGVFTPTEVQNAFVAGCRMVKLFPSEIVGPRYLRALRAPLDDVELVPTGGISPANVAEYVQAGAVAAGIGSALVTGPQQELADLAVRAQALRAAWDEAVHAG
ncbi:MAG: bifunctional 4-hydroxy-2-oxoglutarate aldolase/2-dehydro-3-deoxy-phosphogluconate aldolase [Caldilineaceae bacterium]|nr:bifunctional 4-hydroxy-2-oxoglutarate aldolase/2-dehydro-3-deoxy-phosphogluconate aldolase [Caldilineaceae bacterium]